MITGNENLQEIVNQGNEVIEILKAQGLGKYFEADNIAKTGRFIKLSTLLKSNNIDARSFISKLNSSLSSSQNKESNTSIDNLHFSAMLPCGLRNPFKEFTESYLQENNDIFEHLNYLMEGNVNHELSYYPMLDNIENEEELPDIILASDVNNFFHKPFVNRFISKGYFKAYEPYEPNSYLEKVAYADPNHHFTMYTSNMLIMVVDKTKLGNRAVPKSWSDLLKPEFEKSIIMRGEDDFFCNAIMLPFYKEHGFEAIEILAKNIVKGLHPAEMVKLAGKDAPDGAPVYIMPYFFAKRIKSDNVEIVWPNDGAIASPVFILAKKDKIEEHQKLLQFLFSKEVAEMIQGRYFPVTHPEVDNSKFPEQVKWLGWDFLNNNDIGKLKDDIREVFMNIWENVESN